MKQCVTISFSWAKLKLCRVCFACFLGGGGRGNVLGLFLRFGCFCFFSCEDECDRLVFTFFPSRPSVIGLFFLFFHSEVKGDRLVFVFCLDFECALLVFFFRRLSVLGSFLFLFLLVGGRVCSSCPRKPSALGLFLPFVYEAECARLVLFSSEVHKKKTK